MLICYKNAISMEAYTSSNIIILQTYCSVTFTLTLTIDGMALKLNPQTFALTVDAMPLRHDSVCSQLLRTCQGSET